MEVVEFEVAVFVEFEVVELAEFEVVEPVGFEVFEFVVFEAVAVEFEIFAFEVDVVKMMDLNLKKKYSAEFVVGSLHLVKKIVEFYL